MLKYLTLHHERPMEPVPAGRLLDKLARKFDSNFDGKFSYPGTFRAVCLVYV